MRLTPSARCENVSPRTRPGLRGPRVPGLVVLVTLAGIPQVALGSQFHRLATSAIAFASDGTRYVAWEVAGQERLFVLDTRTGRRFTIKGCGIEDRAPATAGRFLGGCKGEAQALIDVRRRTVTSLPEPPPHLYGEYGPIWTGVGLHYVIGRAGLHARCHRPRRHEGCTALYDIATRVMTEVPETRVPDPDRPGAPPICHGLRAKVFGLSKRDNFEGLGPLAPLESRFSYSDGFVAEPEEMGEAPIRHLRIDRCHGRATILPAPYERRNLEPPPWDVELRAGILTWDTGHVSEAWVQELEQEPNAVADLRHGTLSAYDLHTAKLRSWELPRLTLAVTTGGPEPYRVLGTFGYSAHTDYDLFWVAARSIDCSGKGGCSGPEGLSIYMARL